MKYLFRPGCRSDRLEKCYLPLFAQLQCWLTVPSVTFAFPLSPHLSSFPSPHHSLSLASGRRRRLGRWPIGSSMTSGYDSDLVDGDHLRHLLDQRTARADLHGRFPSLSEVSDSPSIYSHAYFSPQPADRTDTGGSVHQHRLYHTHARQPSEPRSLMSDRQRLNIPGASSLDLEDDPRYSLISELENEGLYDEDDAATEEAADDDTEVHRVSTYGPKMTVHSRAPWETEDDNLDDFEELDSVGLRSAFKFTKRDAKKPWGRDGRTGARPSLESLQSRGKQSFDTTSSQVSAGSALAYAQFS